MSLKVDSLLQEKQALLVETTKLDQVIENIHARKLAIKEQLKKLEKIIVLAADYEDLGAPPTKKNGKRSGTPAQGQQIRQAIVDFLRKNPIGSGGKDITAAVKLPRTTVSYHLKELKTQGLVRTTGTTSNAKWFVTKKGLDYDPA